MPSPLSRVVLACPLLFACADDGEATNTSFETTTLTTTSLGSETQGDGDGDPAGSGDGDGDSTTGDGDGDSTTGDGDGDSTTGDGDGDTDTDGSCFEADLDMGVVPPNVLLLIDKSSSMTMTWDDDGQNTPRWNSLRTVVESLTSNLDDHVRFGVKTYPRLDSGFGECGVDAGADVEFALDNGAEILATLPPNNAPLQGNTPTQPGVESAIAYLNSVYDADPDATPPQAIILIADGGIGCDGSTNQTTAAIASAFAQAPNSISTYVVGIDISAFVDDEMDAYAQAGGHPLDGPLGFYQTTDAQELATALDAAVSDIQACQVPLDPQPGQDVTLEVYVDDVEVPELDACGDQPGYVLEEIDGLLTLVFCGPSCDAVKLSGTANVKYFCLVG